MRAALAALALALTALLAALPALAPGGAAQAGAEPPSAARVELHLGPRGGEAAAAHPFRLARDAEVYAKLLPTPWSPVLPGGAPNGTVAPDRSEGRAGWWARLVLEPRGGAPLDLGHYADSAPTAPVRLAGGEEHVLRVVVHAPADAGALGASFRVDVALAHRDAPGAPVDPAWTFTTELAVARVAPGGGIDPAWAVVAAALLGAGAAGAGVARRVRARATAGDRWL